MNKFITKYNPNKIIIYTGLIIVLFLQTFSVAKTKNNNTAISQYEPLQDSIKSVLNKIEERNEIVKTLDQKLFTERNQLINQIEQVLTIYPSNIYNPQILLRLSELYHEIAINSFDSALTKYEIDLENFEKKKIEKEPIFPTYNFSKPIEIYNRIIEEYPKSKVADDAIYYKALCLEKEYGREEALPHFRKLITVYPKSEYRVEALMKIASYYFDNAKKIGSGYNKAAVIYKKVLAYKENRNFVEAVYRLGWCYYMQDNFSDAISVFKYLVDETNLDFSTKNKSLELTLNPLLRSEAIDCIAISFMEKGGLKEALKFLKLIGDEDYAAKVIMRLGEIQKEQLEEKKAAISYNAVLQDYPLSSEAPFAYIGLIDYYEKRKEFKKAQNLKISFFSKFSRGSMWSVTNNPKQEFRKTDTVAINIMLSSSEKLLREAKGKKEEENMHLYSKVVKNYKKLITIYPEYSGTYEAHWNLAVILDQKSKNYKVAMKEYLALCNNYPKETKHRKEAAINAIAMAQKVLSKKRTIPAESLLTVKKLEPEAQDLIKTCNNFLNLFPNDPEFSRIAYIGASTFYNRGLFAKAIEGFKKIIDINPHTEEFELAMQFTAHSYYAMGKYKNASTWYQNLMQITTSKNIKAEIFKRMVEAKYRIAEKELKNKNYDRAIELFIQIADKYPQSEYAPTVLFNAAEASDKSNKLEKAVNIYLELANKYPKYNNATGAMFNAALDYEKMKKLEKAAETYEALVEKYPKSTQAKDALYNAGLCYEKLSQYDKMAQINEKFVTMFPGAENVERMLFESAKFYKRSGNLDRAYKVFKRYVNTYHGSQREVEAFFLCGEIMKKKELYNIAIIDWGKAVTINEKQKKAGKKGNDYFAAEALFASAEFYKKKYEKIKINWLGKNFKKTQKEKSKALQKAIQEYQKVSQFRSVRIFNATFNIGELYHNFAFNYWKQDRRKAKNPLKKIIMEKKIAENVAKLLSKAIVPYKTTIKLGDNVGDSLPQEAIATIKKAQNKLSETLFLIGDFYMKSALLLEKSPIPDVIKKDVLQYTLYRSKILSTTFPLKIKALNAWQNGRKELIEAHVNNKYSDKLNNALSLANLHRGMDFENLSLEILKGQKMPENLSEDEKEDLSFQLEDIAYDLQDIALEQYKKALEFSKQENLSDKWTQKILERLVAIDPENFSPNKSIIYISLSTDTSWLASNDSSSNWHNINFSDSLWSNAIIGKPQGTVTFDSASPLPIWNKLSTSKSFFHKYFFLNGKPIKSSVQITADDNYHLFVNGTFMAQDDTTNKDWNVVDKYDITSLLKGGDNVICVSANNTDSIGHFLALNMQTKIDTSFNFVSSHKEQRSKEIQVNTIKDTTKADSTILPINHKKVQHNKVIKKRKKKTKLKRKPKKKAKNNLSAKKTILQTKTYKLKLRNIKRAIAREKARIKNLNYQIEYYKLRSKNLNKEIKTIKLRLENKTRSR